MRTLLRWDSTTTKAPSDSSAAQPSKVLKAYVPMPRGETSSPRT